jgi:hypothetical protein
MRPSDHALYGSLEALDARGDLLASIALPGEARMFAACVGLIALLEPEAHQFTRIVNHAALASLPQPLREATAVAANVHASGPRLPYSDRARDVLGVDASFGRIVDPLLELREAITIARAIREQCMRAIDEGFAQRELSIAGPLGVLVELRELGIATNPDLVDDWLTARTISDAYRAAFQLLAVAPERKLLGSDPTTTARSRRL